MKEFLSQNNIVYSYVDITSSIFNLKMFLKFRDNYPQFDKVKKKGKVGIPCVVVNNGERILFEDSEDIVDELR